MANGPVALDFSKAQPVQPQQGQPQPDSNVTLDFSKAQPIDAGTTPSASEQPDQSLTQKYESMIKGPGGLEETGRNVAAGLAKGAENTVAGVSSLLHRGISAISPSLAEKVAPQVGINAAKAQSTPTNLGQMVGYGGETLIEFLLGDEALKGLSLADKLKQASGAAAILQRSPRLMRAIQLGADISKAQGELGPAEQEAIKNSPILARLVGTGMDALRQGTVQAAQTGIKTGSASQAASEGGAMAGASAALGFPASIVGGAVEKAGNLGKTLAEANEATKAASDLAKTAGTHQDVVTATKQALDAAENQMHAEFESGVNKIVSDLGDAKVPVANSPLQQQAKDLLTSLPPDTKLPSELQESMKGIVPGTERIEPLLKKLADPKDMELGADSLIQLRQDIGARVRQLPIGDPNARTLRKVQYSIDDTLGKLADKSGNPNAAQDYTQLRNNYKDKIKYFDTSKPEGRLLQSLQTGNIDDVSKNLASGGKTRAKIQALKGAIGQDNVDNLATNLVKGWAADATDAEGNFNPKAMLKTWNRLPADSRAELFSSANEGLQNMLNDLNKNPNVDPKVTQGLTQLARAAVGAAGGAYVGNKLWGEKGGQGLALSGAIVGMMWHGGERDLAMQMVKYIADHPGTLTIPAKAAEKIRPVTQALSPVIKQQATQTLLGKPSLANVYQGAAQPLGENQ